jgi:hypothetical protein
VIHDAYKIDPVQFRLYHVHKRRHASQALAGETASKYYYIVIITFRGIIKPLNINLHVCLNLLVLYSCQSKPVRTSRENTLEYSIPHYREKISIGKFLRPSGIAYQQVHSCC